MVLSPGRVLFVGTRREGKVYAVLDKNSDNRADTVVVIAEDLFMPNGVAFRDGSLFVAEVNRILGFDHIESRLPITVGNTLLLVRTTDFMFQWAPHAMSAMKVIRVLHPLCACNRMAAICKYSPTVFATP